MGSRGRAEPRPFGVYDGLYLQELALPAWVAGIPLWAAAYGPKVRIANPWTKAMIWQYKGNVSVLPKGVVVDLNRAFGREGAVRKALGID